MDFSIIIPAYQAAAVLPQCLNALHRQSIDRSRYEIIVVDDGSTDNTATVAEQVLNTSSAQDIHATQVIRATHGGPAQARNLGAQAAQGSLLLFTDADCEPVPDWIEQISSVFVDPSISGAKGTYRTRQTSLMARFVQQEYQERYDRLQRLAPIDFVDTYSAAYRRDVFIDQGGFDAVGLPTASVEDQEFSFRLTASGHRLVFVPEAVVYHQHNASLRRYFRRKYYIGCWKIYCPAAASGQSVARLAHPANDQGADRAVSRRLVDHPGSAAVPDRARCPDRVVDRLLPHDGAAADQNRAARSRRAARRTHS